MKHTVIILIIAITSDTAHDPNSELNGVTDSDKSPSMKSSKIFSLPNHMGTLLPVLETVSPSDSLFSTKRVSCVMEKKKEKEKEMLTHVAFTHAMFIVFKTVKVKQKNNEIQRKLVQHEQ